MFCMFDLMKNLLVGIEKNIRTFAILLEDTQLHDTKTFLLKYFSIVPAKIKKAHSN